MSRFKRLTELLDRIEAERAYWFRKRNMTEADDAAYREFSRIMHAYLSPSGAIQAALDTVEGRGSDYWETRPGEEAIELPSALAMDTNQRAALDYARRNFLATPGEDEED